jgi:hypothetical protein
MAARALPAPTGFWGSWWTLLTAPATPAVLLLALGAAAIVGLRAEAGAHPATTILAAIPAALLPFSVAARAFGQPRSVLLPRALWAAGLGLAVVGGVVAGGGAGTARVRPGETVERYLRIASGRATPYHLGGQLTVDLDGGAANLWLGVREAELGRATLPLEGAREVRLGPWAVSLADVEPGGAPTRLRFRARPRAGGEPVQGVVGVGQTVELTKDVRVTALRLSGDFGGALGAAAQLQIDWPEGQQAAWHFVDGGDLDARVGTAPWIIEPLELLADPALVLNVRRPGTPWLAVAGWILMAAALVTGLRARAGAPT